MHYLCYLDFDYLLLHEEYLLDNHEKLQQLSSRNHIDDTISKLY